MRHKTIGIGLATAVCILMLGPVAAQQRPQNPAIDVETLGPQVGATVPDLQPA